MSRKLIAAIVAGIAVAAALLSGCGSSQTVGRVARAADVTANVKGYRMAGTVSVTNAGSAVSGSIAGVFDRANRSGTLDANETIGGRRLQFTEVFSGLTFYLRSSNLAALKQVTGGKRWLKFDMSRLLGAVGLGSLPTAGTDPSQFVDFLRAVSSATTKLGTDTVRGVRTTHYHAIIDLDKYPKLAPSAQRKSAARSIATLESALGGHTMPMDAWIDRRNLVRRLGLAFSECVASQKIRFNMTMDLYDYGRQPRTQLPAASDAYDLTPLLSSSLSKIKFGCAPG